MSLPRTSRVQCSCGAKRCAGFVSGKPKCRKCLKKALQKMVKMRAAEQAFDILGESK